MNTAEPSTLLTASGDAHAKGVGGTRPFATYQTGVTLRNGNFSRHLFWYGKTYDCAKAQGLCPPGDMLSRKRW